MLPAGIVEQPSAARPGIACHHLASYERRHEQAVPGGQHGCDPPHSQRAAVRNARSLMPVHPDCLAAAMKLAARRLCCRCLVPKRAARRWSWSAGLERALRSCALSCACCRGCCAAAGACRHRCYVAGQHAAQPLLRRCCDGERRRQRLHASLRQLNRSASLAAVDQRRHRRMMLGNG